MRTISPVIQSRPSSNDIDTEIIVNLRRDYFLGRWRHIRVWIIDPFILCVIPNPWPACCWLFEAVFPGTWGYCKCHDKSYRQ